MGVATQDESLRAKFRGKADYVESYFRFLAQEVREYLAELGFTRLDDIVGRTDLLFEPLAEGDDKASRVSLDRLLVRTDGGDTSVALHRTRTAPLELQAGLGDLIVADLMPFVKARARVNFHYPIHNTDRAVGTSVAGHIARLYGAEGLPDNTINCTFEGSAGQSFGAFLTRGMTFRLRGEANDYVGKGLSGGALIITPPFDAKFAPEENIIAGNTILYGATSGELYVNGCVGERFSVRNSGATAVVEGVGDHCCEYMTGGRVVVLGPTGRNFAAGMSGGIAYVRDVEGDFDERCNMEMVELSLVEERRDKHELRALIERHFELTQSPLARRILDNWDEEVTRFIKVMPIEYKRILQEEEMKKLQERIAGVERDY
jgi:glutamate synthase (NADPH/NADH) large chain